MKKHLTTLLSFLVLSIFSGCETDDVPVSEFNAQWQVYSIKVLEIGNSEACNYQTKPSDFYHKPTNSICQDDDIYDFRNLNILTIYSGGKKCSSSEPDKVTKSYERKGDKLIIDGQSYSIVMLTKDTLIIDNCEALNLNPSGYGKIGTKLISKK